MAETVEITGDFDRQDGDSAYPGTLRFTLNKRDYDGNLIIEQHPQSITLDPATGTFSGLMIWPNDRGIEGSAYKVEYQPLNSTTWVTLFDAVRVPSGGPHNIADLVGMSKLAATLRVAQIQRLTETQYNDRLAAGTLADGLYLVEIA